jgi:diadenosine tetraphosphate (Ap4A) HIT family hydrolase
MSHEFRAIIRNEPEGGFRVSAHHVHYTPSRQEDEHVLEWVHCDTYEEAEDMITQKARRRGFRPDQIHWDD